MNQKMQLDIEEEAKTRDLDYALRISNMKWAFVLGIVR